VEKITDISRTYTLELSADQLNQQLGLVQEEVPGPFVGTTRVQLRVARQATKLLLAGDISAALALQCSRCLASVSAGLAESFEMCLNLVPDVQPEVEELELGEDEIDSIAVSAGEIDLMPLLLEQLLVGLPIQPLCQESCLGLCPVCGVNRNLESCNCTPKPFNNRFGKLIDLKVGRS
jgi:uncharacterized protein